MTTIWVDVTFVNGEPLSARLFWSQLILTSILTMQISSAPHVAKDFLEKEPWQIILKFFMKSCLENINADTVTFWVIRDWLLAAILWINTNKIYFIINIDSESFIAKILSKKASRDFAFEKERWRFLRISLRSRYVFENFSVKLWVGQKPVSISDIKYSRFYKGITRYKYILTSTKWLKTFGFRAHSVHLKFL